MTTRRFFLRDSALAMVGVGASPLWLERALYAGDAPGNVYAALASFDPATHGVWRISPRGVSERIAALDPAGFPNALAFDERGNLFVSDSLLATIWRIDNASPWPREVCIGRNQLKQRP